MKRNNKSGSFTNNNLVSIIIPCYNAEKNLAETLNSIDNQTYRNIEVICVNDGSEDNTYKILKDWSNKTKLKNIIINQKNFGVSYSRNVGIEKASGKYIMFLDSDDLYSKYLVAILIDEIVSNNKDTAYCLFDRNIKDINANLNVNIVHQSQDDTMKNLLYNMSKISFACFIYKSDLLKYHNIRFDEDTKYMEDREFIWKYLCWCTNISFINCALYFYRINKNSATNKVATWERTKSLETVNRIEKYLLDSNCNFYNELKSYLYSRVVWTLTKNFAIGKNKELYNKFIHEYNVKKHMKKMLKDKQKSVKIGSILYLINPNVFYFILSKYNK